MSNFHPQAELENLLPSGHGLSDDQLTACTAAGSADAMGMLAHLYWTFPDYSYAVGPPVVEVSPPWPVRESSWYFAAVHAEHMRASTNLVDDDSIIKQRWEHARRILADYASGERQLPTDTQTDLIKDAAFGAGTLDSDCAYLSKTSCEVIPESTHISGYEYGEDFRVYYDPNERRWIIQRFDSDIGNGSTGDSVIYDFNYLKKREVIMPRVQNIQLMRG